MSSFELLTTKSLFNLSTFVYFNKILQLNSLIKYIIALDTILFLLGLKKSNFDIWQACIK